MSNWEDFQSVINSSRGELEKEERACAQRIEWFIKVAANIIRFIDQKILINLHVLSSGNDMKFVPEYYSENGILAYVNNTDHFESTVETLRVNDVFPAEQKESRHLRGIRGGEELYLTRSQKLIGFTRAGGVWDAWSSEIEGDYYALAEPHECSALELVKKYENFEQEFLFNFKLAIVTAIQRNENKRFMLKRVIEFINSMDQNKQQGIDLRNRLEHDDDSAQAHLEYAVYLATKKNDRTGAKEQFQVALELEPSNPEIHMRYGEFLFHGLWQWRETLFGPLPAQQMRNEAEQQLLAAIELAPENLEAHVIYANFLLEGHKKEDLLAWAQNNPEEIEKIDAEYRRIFELDPDNARALFNYMHYLFWAKADYDTVIQACEHLLELDSEKYGTSLFGPGPGMIGHYLRAIYQNWLQDANLRRRWSPNQAEQWLHRAEELDGTRLEKYQDNWSLHFFHAELLLWEMHDVNAAELELQKCLESEPENPEFGAVQSAVAHSALGDILFLGRNDRQGARHEYETAFDAGLRGLVSLQLASVDFLDGNIDEGLARIQDILSTQPLYYQTTELIVTESFFLIAYSKDPDSQQDALADLKAKLKTFFTKQATNSEMQYFGMKFGITYNCHDWFIIQLPWHVKQAIRNGYPNPKFLRALANVISQTAPATILEKFPEYHEHAGDTWNFPAR